MRQIVFSIILTVPFLFPLIPADGAVITVDPPITEDSSSINPADEYLIARRRTYSKRRYRRYRRKSKPLNIYINVDGSLGIGYYEVPSGAIKGGMNINLDVLPFDFGFVNMGFSSGLLSIMDSNIKITEEQPDDPDTGQPVDPVIRNVETSVNACPLNVMFMKYFKNRDWNSIPYIHLSPGLYFIDENVNDESDYALGYGAAAGIGLLIPLSTSIYIDLGVRLHWFMDSMTEVPGAFEDATYIILSSSIGICYRL